MAIEALAEIGSDDAIGTLTLDEAEPGLRKLAVDYLAEIGSDSAMLLLQRLLSDDDGPVRAAAGEHLQYR